jgi:hypothetical protein
MIDTTIADLFRVVGSTWRLNDPVVVNRLVGGEVLTASAGAPLWTGSLELVQGYHAHQAEIEARIIELQDPGVRFRTHDPRFNGPRLDPGGFILGSATPTIHTLDTDNLRLRVTGLPVGYTLSPGDYIGWTYGSSPTRRALHRVVTAATASAGGLTPLFRVRPHIRLGAVTGAAVQLVRPQITARLIGVDYGKVVPLITPGARLDFIQTLRE